MGLIQPWGCEKWGHVAEPQGCILWEGTVYFLVCKISVFLVQLLDFTSFELKIPQEKLAVKLYPPCRPQCGWSVSSFPVRASLASLVAPMVKNLSALQETRVRSLDEEDALEEEMVTHSSFPAWRIPWTEEPVGLYTMGSQRVGRDWATNTSWESRFFKAEEVKGWSLPNTRGKEGLSPSSPSSSFEEGLEGEKLAFKISLCWVP